MTKLEQVIHDTIKEVYKKQFTGHLKVDELEPEGYRVRMYIQNDCYPVSVAAQLPWEKFIKFFKQELRTMHWNHSHWYTGVQSFPDQCEDLNKSCACQTKN